MGLFKRRQEEKEERNKIRIRKFIDENGIISTKDIYEKEKITTFFNVLSPLIKNGYINEIKIKEIPLLDKTQYPKHFFVDGRRFTNLTYELTEKGIEYFRKL